MDFSSYRFSYLKSIICSSIVSTTVIFSILSSPCFSDSAPPESNSDSILISSSFSSPYPQDRQHSSSRHHYNIKQQRKTLALTYWNQQEGSWSFASSHHSVTSYNHRGNRSSKRRSLYNPVSALSTIYGSNGAEVELRAADPDNYDAQTAILLRYRQQPQRSRVPDLRRRSQRWIVESLFRSHSPLNREDIYEDGWDEKEEEEENEYEDGDYDFREEQIEDHEMTEFDNRVAEEAKDKEKHALDAILRPASTSSCPWIPQWTWITWKHYSHIQQQQGRCRLRRLYPKRDLLVDSQPHQQQEQLPRQPISHKQLPPRSWTRTERTRRLDSQYPYPQRPYRQQKHNHPHNKYDRQNKHLHTAGGRHSRRSRNGRRTSSPKSFSSACTSFINRVLPLSSPSFSFLSTKAEYHRIVVYYLSDPLKFTKSTKGAMDTLLYFLSNLPNGLSSLFHQDFASALFSTTPPNTSKRFSYQQQHHALSTLWFSNYNPYGSSNVHGPQRIPPHPLLEMAASNILIRLGLLVVLCLGAFYYCVTTMEQQQRQIAGTDGGAGSNWLADPIPASSAAATNSISTTDPTAGAPTTTGSNISQGSITLERGATNTLLTPGMTAAEVMASLGRSVTNLEQLHRQQLQQQSTDGQPLNLSLVNGRHSGLESTDSTTTPLTPTSITATIISALLRSTATAISLTCGADNHLQPPLSPYSASTTPAIPCSNVFSGPESNKVTEVKYGFEPDWKGSVKKDVDTESHALKMKDTRLPLHKDKQKDLDNSDDDDDDDDEGIYQSEQEFGHFSTAGPFDTKEDAWREYRNMMYYSSNYPPGGGESSRSNSRRSSVFAPSPSPLASISDQIALATTTVVNHTNENQGLTEAEEEEEEAELPFWTHFYTLDALQSTICHRLAAATATGKPPTFPSHPQKSHGPCSRALPRQKQDRAKARRQIRTARRAILNRSPSIPSPSSTSTSASISSPSSSSSGSVSASIVSTSSTSSTRRSTFSPRRRRARATRHQHLLQ